MPDKKKGKKAQPKSLETRMYPLIVKNGRGSGYYRAGTKAPISAMVPEGDAFVRWWTHKEDEIIADKYSKDTFVNMPARMLLVQASFHDAGFAPTFAPAVVQTKEPVTPSPLTGGTEPAPVTQGGEKVSQNNGTKFPWSTVVVLLAVLALVGAAYVYGRYLPTMTDAAQPVEAPTVVVQPTALPPAPTEAPATGQTSVPQGEQSVLSVPAAKEGVADVRDVTGQEAQGNWDVTFYEGATDQMHGWFGKLRNLAPSLWPTFPNVPNQLVPDFRAIACPDDPSKLCVPDGLEYGLDERNYCPQETCDVVVAAGEYNLITADYDFGFIECRAKDRIGCAVMFVNVGNETANFEQVVVDNGFSVAGRYFNGDKLEWGIWGGLSHAAANMMNLNTSLNRADWTNAGANCSVREGCVGVQARVVITSGNQVLVIGTTTVNR